MSKRLNGELILENMVGIMAAGLVLVGMAASAFCVLNNPEPAAVKTATINQPKKEQTIQAKSVSANNVEKLYQQKRDELAAKKAADLAEKKRIETEKQRLIAKKKRLAELEKQKKAEALAEKKRLEEEAERVEKKKQRLAEEEKQKKIKKQEEKKKLEEEKKRLAKEKKRLAEQERQRKADAEQKRKEEAKKKAEAEAEKKRKAEEAKKKAKEEKQRKAEEEEERARIAKELADEIAGREAEEQRVAEENAKAKAVQQFGAAISNKVKGRWVIPAKLPEGLSAILQIKTTPHGDIKSVQIIRSSGNIAFDHSAIQAVKESAPLPMPEKAEWAKEFDTIDMRFPE